MELNIAAHAHLSADSPRRKALAEAGTPLSAQGALWNR